MQNREHYELSADFEPHVAEDGLIADLLSGGCAPLIRRRSIRGKLKHQFVALAQRWLDVELVQIAICCAQELTVKKHRARHGRPLDDDADLFVRVEARRTAEMTSAGKAARC